MAIQKSECPSGGNHTWVAVNPGTWKCSKCPAIRRTGSKNNQTKQGAVTISTLLLILVVIIGGYYLAKPVIAAEQSQASDPVAMLKGHLNRLQKSCANGEVIDFGGVKYTCQGLYDLRYDVQKTSSLISPYLGRISFKVASLNYGKPTGNYAAFDITLALQDGQWVLTDLESRQSVYGKFINCNDPTFTELCRQGREMDIRQYRQRLGVQ